MKVDYLNPVIHACSSIIKVLLFQNIRLGVLKLVREHNLKDAIAFVFWMTGDFEGRFIFSMKRQVALRIAGIMMGTNVQLLNDMSKSAIAELASMILGRSGVLYAKHDMSVRISYPTIIDGELVYVAPLAGKGNGKIILVPLVFENGDIIDMRVEKTSEK